MPIVLSIVDWIPVLYCGQWWWVLDGTLGLRNYVQSSSVCVCPPLLYVRLDYRFSIVVSDGGCWVAPGVS